MIRGFSPPAVPWGPGHRGVDLAARPGQPVYSAGAGRVSYAGTLAGRGVVAVTHGPFRTTYLPVHPTVHRGAQVKAGTRIGVLEPSQHCPTEPCLHWGLLEGHIYRDPLSLVRPHVRLLPLWPPYNHPPSPSTPQTPSPPPSPPQRQPDSPMALRSATTATGGAMAGMLLAFTLTLLARTARTRTRSRRLPPGVIDLAKERRHRRPLPDRPI
ncbi:M23 family metallopeptidase [Actinomadura barringtoniae]|uniref:M23 family metallopeptidase n=1 Tax=Actinomadura barringtoniae TaxID=1427535 RepID=UPI0027DDDF43|nr:M23 family metallopeptidase [Actinomadura barringtoniae]